MFTVETVQMSVVGFEKNRQLQRHITVRITNPQACANALGSTADGLLFSDLASFLEDALDVTTDHADVQINPQNAKVVLEHLSTPLPPAPVIAKVAAEKPAAVAVLPGRASTVHDPNVTIAPVAPAPVAPLAPPAPAQEPAKVEAEATEAEAESKAS